MSRYKPYPEYKDSGVEWIGEVPAHWEVASSVSRILSRLVVVPVSELKEQPLFHFSIPVVQETGDGSYQDGVEVQSSKLLIDRPVVLVAKLNPRKGTVCKATPRSGFLTVCSGEFVPLQAKDVGLDYLYYVVSSDAYRQRLEACVESVTRSHQRASPDKVAKFLWAFPPRQEEDQIAAFLDRETTRIDTLIEKKRCFIELLEEKRQAVITQAVTKGLDPNVPMKDSGVEWIGEVPAHWEVKKLSYLCRCYDGSRVPLNALERDSRKGSVPYWGASKIIDYVDESLFDEELILLGEDGAPFFDGNKHVAFHSNGPIWPNNHVHVLKPTATSDAPFLVHVLNTTDYTFFVDGATRDKLTQSSMMQIPIQYPPDQERERIVLHVTRETTRIDTLIEKTRDSIELLKERRSALITAAVTGKIDVREEAA